MKRRIHFLSVFLIFILCFSLWTTNISAAASVSIDVLNCSEVYNGAARTATNDLYLYGDADVNGYVEYTVEIPEDGVYRLDAAYSLQGAENFTHLKIAADGVLLEEITRLPKTAAPWTRKDAVLHRKVPFLAGTRTLRIYLCGQYVKSGMLLYQLTLSRLGAYQAPESTASSVVPVIDTMQPTQISDGEVRTDGVYLYGDNTSIGWVEYNIHAEKTGFFRLLSKVSVGAEDTAKLHIAVDGVKLEETAVIPPCSESWAVRDVVLFENIYLTEGEHTLRIYQAELVSHLLLHSLYFENCADGVSLYHLDSGSAIRTDYVEFAGNYLVKYAQKRMESGMMLACAYDADGRMTAANAAVFFPGSYDVLADLSGISSGSSIKVFFMENLASVRPMKENVSFTKVDHISPRDIYVAPHGSDEGPGTKDAPFATIQKARDTIRTFGAFTKDVSVYIAPGEYHLKSPLRFTEQDSGKDGFNVIYRAQDENNPPVISGGTKIQNWSHWQNGIYKATAEIENTRTLYINDNPAIRARSKYLYEPLEMLEGGIRLPSVNFPESFAHPEEMELIWPLNWTAQRTPVEDITYSGTNVELTLRQPAYDIVTSEKNNPYTTPDAEKPFYMENALELLDEPGEFYFDKTGKQIYYYPFPEEDLQTASVYAGTCDFLVQISGSSVQTKASNLVFDGLAFRYGAWNALTDSPNGISVGQADSIRGGNETENTLFGSNHYRKYEMLPAQFAVEKAERITIKNSSFACLGSSAISMSNAVSDSVISGNVIRDVAGSGVVLGHWNHVNQEGMAAGEDRCKNIEIANNVIRRAATEFMHCCGISMYYTNGAYVHHNDIRELPYTGISLGWGWGLETVEDFGNNRIMHNRIEDVTGVLDDGAHIYTLGTSHDNEILGNYLVKGGDYRGGVYLDEASSGVTVSENVIEQCLYWLNARQNIGLDNTVIEDNFIDSDARYNWVTGTYTKENELQDMIDAETVYGDKICHNTYQNNTRMTESRPERAQNIIERAGLLSEYRALIDKGARPDWRKDLRAMVPQGTYHGTNGWIESEDFDPTEGVGYLRQGTSMSVTHYPYREDASDVSIVPVNYWGTRDFVITNTQNKDWFAYTRVIDRAGLYDVRVRVANGGNTSYLNVYVDGEKVITRAEIANTGDYQTYHTLNLGALNLTVGEHTIKFEIENVGLHLDRWSLSSDTFTENDPSYHEGFENKNK